MHQLVRLQMHDALCAIKMLQGGFHAAYLSGIRAAEEALQGSELCMLCMLCGVLLKVWKHERCIEHPCQLLLRAVWSKMRDVRSCSGVSMKALSEIFVSSVYAHCVHLSLVLELS